MFNAHIEQYQGIQPSVVSLQPILNHFFLRGWECKRHRGSKEDVFNF